MVEDSSFEFKRDLGGIAELIQMKKDFKKTQKDVVKLN
jgi:hypothetical protein